MSEWEIRLAEERFCLWLEQAGAWTLGKRERVRQITEQLGHDWREWYRDGDVYDKERKQRERAGFKSSLASLDFHSLDPESEYLHDMAEYVEDDSADPTALGIRLWTTDPHEVAAETAHYLLAQKPWWLTDLQWRYFQILGGVGLLDGQRPTQRSVSEHVGQEPRWGERLHDRLRERMRETFDHLGYSPPLPTKAELRRRRDQMLENKRRHRAWLQAHGYGVITWERPAWFKPVPKPEHVRHFVTASPRRTYIEGWAPKIGGGEKWGRPQRSHSERLREVREIANSSGKMDYFRPYILGPIPFQPRPPEPTIILEIAPMSEKNEQWRVWLFTCYPNETNELSLWWGAQNGGPPLIAPNAKRLAEKIRVYSKA